MSEDLREEVLGLASDLVRIDTSNPPGGETPAAEFLATYLHQAGVCSELVGPDPERLNLVARIEGSGDGPSLMLVAHTDVVPAAGEGWTVPPFDGVIRDGRLIGRGSTDMKNELAARAVAFAAFARSGETPRGDIVLVAQADEEANVSDVGMSWLVRERPDIRCDYALDEGGGSLFELANGRRVMTVSIGEKQITSLRLRFLGHAGHASLPARADNPIRAASVGVERLLAHEPPVSVLPSLARALSAIGAPDAGEAEVLAWAAAQHPLLESLIPAMTRMTVTPTGLRTAEPSNVIPPFADVTCDCRALPGETEADIRREVALALGDDLPHELEFLEPLVGGTESEIDSPLYRVCQEYARTRAGAELLPVVTPGFSDSYWVRQAFGTAAYGFAPILNDDPVAYFDAAHAADESLAIDDLVDMAEFHLHALRALGISAAQSFG
jgi:acetylornithine deacetylase/succinyl-diaminopimelate desuccinylase-like protein